MSSMMTRAIRAATDTASALDAADTILCRNLRYQRLNGDYQAREFATGLEGAQREELYNRHAGAEFEVEAAAGGAAGTPPVYAHLLEACGLTETISAGVSASYAPTATGTPPAEERLELRDGKLTQVIRKARGSMTFTAEVNRKPMFGFSFLGQYAAPGDGAVAAGDFTGWRAALECTPVNMNAFTFDGVALCVRSFTFTDGRTPRVGRFMTCDGTDITPRRATGRMTVEMPARGTLDIVAACAAAQTHPLVFQLGATAGDILRVAAPAVQIKYAGEQDIDGVIGANLDLVFAVDQGDDEFAISFQ